MMGTECRGNAARVAHKRGGALTTGSGLDGYRQRTCATRGFRADLVSARPHLRRGVPCTCPSADSL